MKLLIFIRTMLRSWLDSYVVPGTLTGTEILWIYMTAWRRRMAGLALASLYFFSSHIPTLPLIRAEAEADD